VIDRTGHGGGVTGLIVILKFCVTLCGVGEQLSVALTVNDEVPAVVGVPEMRPDALKLNPGGNVPDARLKLIVPCPPAVVIWPPL
jgi:hypothetical protein